VRVLVTAGSTEGPIDKVRFIGNIFKGKTGHGIACYFAILRDDVTLITSGDLPSLEEFPTLRAFRYRTFDELKDRMAHEICYGSYDVVIHSAAVGDYKVSGVYVSRNSELCPIDNNRKIPSSYDKLFLELTLTIKIVDQIREPWGFKGKLVKFKLQEGISDEELIAIAKESLKVSRADFIVANCLEWYKERAYIIGADGYCDNVSREKLNQRLGELLS